MSIHATLTSPVFISDPTCFDHSPQKLNKKLLGRELELPCASKERYLCPCIMHIYIPLKIQPAQLGCLNWYVPVHVAQLVECLPGVQYVTGLHLT